MPTLVTKLNIQIDEGKILKNKGLELYGPVQKAVDSECIRLVQPYVPFKQGVLAGAFHRTDIGSGLIIQDTPYARYLYYGELYVDPITKKGAFHDEQSGRFWSRPGVQKEPSGKPLQYDTSRHPQAGPFWFDRMKADHIEDIIKVAKEHII